MYKNKKTSLHNQFKKYKMKAIDDFYVDLKDLIAGAKRIASKAKQDGMGSLEEGKRELTIDLYQNINIWLIDNGSPSLLLLLHFCLTWNLMFQVESTDGVCIKPLVWSQNAVGVRFSHTKNDQDGYKNFKPRHCYTNPEGFALCPITA